MPALTKTDYNRWTEEQWRTKTVRCLRPLTNGNNTAPAGTVFEVRHKFKGLDLRSAPCAHCGMQMNVSKVSISALELVP